MSVGSTGFETLTRVFSDPMSNQIIWMIRLPRSIGALLAGALLGMTGAIAQGLFRNPLADPYLLGSASGASFAVAISLVLFGGSPFASYLLIRIGLTGAAFSGAVIAVLWGSKYLTAAAVRSDCCGHFWSHELNRCFDFT
jgi:iron complex transport system permease protein